MTACGHPISRARVLCCALAAIIVLLLVHAPPGGATLPPASYPSTYSEQTFITMDDGVQLGATITFPSQDGKTSAPGRFPVVLEMTPYGRTGVCGCDSASDFATRGYVFAVVDVRGTGGSQGNLNGNYFSPREARDGYDLVEYLGTRPWSNGRVGMAGGSYLGITQLETAEQDPPHLAAIAPDEALADLYNDAAFPGGIFDLSFDAQYLAVQGGPGLVSPNTDPSMIPGTITAKYDQATGRSIAFDYLANPYDDTFYHDRSPIWRASAIKVPTFVIDGWRDFFEAGDIRMFQALESRPGVETDLHIDPCTHKGCGGPEAPTDSPPDPDDVVAQELHFFARYLKGETLPSLPRVRLYIQQRNAYVDTTAWPPPQTAFQRYYLDPGGLLGATSQPGSSSYFTDPAAGFSMTFDEAGTVAISPYIPTDQRLEDEQGLTWRTAAAAAPETLAGPIALHLVAASTASDTDWFAKISDVAPDGSESIVAEGQLRASMRALAPSSTAIEPLQTLDNPQPITPGTFYDYDIAIAPTGYELEPGHRLQLRVTSDNLPNALPGSVDFDANNPAAFSFQPLLPATNTVRFGGADGSSLLVPVYGAAGASPSPSAAAAPAVRSPACVAPQASSLRVSVPRGQRIVRVRAIAGRRHLRARTHGEGSRSVVTLTGLPRGAYRVTVVAVTDRGRRITRSREYRICVATRTRAKKPARRRTHSGRRA